MCGDADLGFAVWPDVLSGVEVTALADSLGDVGGRSRAGVRHLMAHAPVAALAHDSRLLALAATVLGSKVQPYRATLFDKSPDSNWLVVWHQDTALPLRVRHDRSGWGPWSTKAGVLYAHAPARALEAVVALRLHLDDSAPTNGPLCVLPGTHLRGVLTDAAIHDLSRERAAHPCTVARGGGVAMRPLLVHASSKSTSAAPRRVVHIEYAKSLQLEADLELAVA